MAMHRGKKCVQLGKGDIPPYVLCAELTDCGTETLLTPTKQAGEKGSHVKRRRSRGLLHLFLPWNKNLRRAAGKNIEKCSLCLVICLTKAEREGERTADTKMERELCVQVYFHDDLF